MIGQDPPGCCPDILTPVAEHLQSTQPGPVWVDLAHAFGQPPTPTTGHGYRLCGDLHKWVRTTAGR